MLTKLKDVGISNPVHVELLKQEMKLYVSDPFVTECRFVITDQMLQNNENMEKWLTTELGFTEMMLPNGRVLTISSSKVIKCNRFQYLIYLRHYYR